MTEVTENQEGIKVFRMNEYEWYAAKSLMELLIWYDKSVNSIEDPDELHEIEECNIDTDGTWVESESEEDAERLGDAKELVHLDEHSRWKPEFGDLKRVGTEIWRWCSFRSVLSNTEYKEPYCISGMEC